MSLQRKLKDNRPKAFLVLFCMLFWLTLHIFNPSHKKIRYEFHTMNVQNGFKKYEYFTVGTLIRDIAQK